MYILEVEAMAREEPCEVEPCATGTRVSHTTVVSMAAHSDWVVGGDGDGRDGFKGRRLRSMHAGEPVSEVVLSTRDVADEEDEGGQVGTPAHDLGNKGCVHPAEVVVVGLDNEGLAVEVVG